MYELLIAFGCLIMFFAPVTIASLLTRREEMRSALDELSTLDLVGKRSDGSLYSLPGYVVVQPKSVSSRSSAQSRVA